MYMRMRSYFRKLTEKMHRYLAEPDSGVFLHGAILVNKKNNKLCTGLTKYEGSSIYTIGKPLCGVVIVN